MTKKKARKGSPPAKKTTMLGDKAIDLSRLQLEEPSGLDRTMPLSLSKLAKLIGEPPPLLVSFLAHAGGCRVRDDWVVAPYKGTYSFPVVYSLREGEPDGYRVLVELAEMRSQWPDVPPTVLPFACTLNGPSEGFAFVELSDGSVGAWVAAKPAWTGRATTDTFLKLADSFEDYLKRLGTRK